MSILVKKILIIGLSLIVTCSTEVVKDKNTKLEIKTDDNADSEHVTQTEKRFYGRWKSSNHLHRQLQKADKDEVIELIDKHRGITWSKRNLKEKILNNKNSFYYLMKILQYLTDNQQELSNELINEKRHYGRWRSSNYLSNRIKGMVSKSDRDSTIDKHLGLMWTKRNPNQFQDIDNVKIPGRMRNVDYLMKLLTYPVIAEGNEGELRQKDTKQDAEISDDMLQQKMPSSRRKRFIGRSKNSNYIWTKHMDVDELQKFIRNHWAMNWNKRAERTYSTDKKASVNSPDLAVDDGSQWGHGLSLGWWMNGLTKRSIRGVHHDRGYSLLRSHLINQADSANWRALLMYLTP